MLLFLFRKHFKPIAIGIFNEINSHVLVFIADTVHLFMFLIGSVKIIYIKSKMEVVVSMVVSFCAVTIPRKFNLIVVGLV